MTRQKFTNEAINGRSSGAAALRVAAAAVLFSTGGAAIKTASLSGLQVASIRSGIAAIALLFWLRGRATQSTSTLAVGGLYAATLVLFVTSTKLTTAASAIFLQSTAPLYIALFAPFLIGERFRSRDLAFLAAAAAGLVLCVWDRAAATAAAPDPATGNLLGILCSLTWAFTLIGFRWIERGQQGTAISAVVAGNLIAFGVGVPVLVPLPSASPLDWAALVYLGSFRSASRMCSSRAPSDTFRRCTCRCCCSSNRCSILSGRGSCAASSQAP